MAHSSLFGYLAPLSALSLELGFPSVASPMQRLLTAHVLLSAHQRHVFTGAQQGPSSESQICPSHPKPPGALPVLMAVRWAPWSPRPPCGPASLPGSARGAPWLWEEPGKPHLWVTSPNKGSSEPDRPAVEMGKGSRDISPSSFSQLMWSCLGHLCTHHHPCGLTWSHCWSWGWTTSSHSMVPHTSSTDPAPRASRGWRLARLPQQ